MVRERDRGWLVCLCLALPAALGGETRSVPRDYATIKSAVRAAAPWDTVEVDDGYYFEDTIILEQAPASSGPGTRSGPWSTARAKAFGPKRYSSSGLPSSSKGSS